MGDLVQLRDYQSKSAIERAHKALEEHFNHLEAEIAVALWCNDAGTVGMPIDISGQVLGITDQSYYMARESDPA